MPSRTPILPRLGAKSTAVSATMTIVAVDLPVPEPAVPRLSIEYCTQCGWTARAAWLAQELLTTFQHEVAEVALVPGTGGVLVVRVDGEVVWDRRDDGFPLPTDLKQRVRDSDTVARVGGDEFAIVLPDTTSEGALAVGDRVRERVAAHPFLQGEGFQIALTVSVGVATLPDVSISADGLIHAADSAMYFVKDRGKNGIHVAG